MAARSAVGHASHLALVTGAGGALGAAICLQLARAGCAIAACDVDAERARRTVARLRSARRRAFAVEADVGQAADVARLFAELSRRQQAPAIVVHAAGTPGRFAFLSELTDADWRSVFATHLDGAFHCLRAAVPAMRAGGFGRVIHIASLAGIYGTVGSGAYSAAKAGLIGLTRAAAKELGPWSITVNAIAPGMIATPPNEALREKGSGFIGAALAETPTRAMSRPEDIAALVAFLAGPAASNINGQVIEHDGGAGMSGAIDEFMRTRLEPRAPREGGRS